MTKPKLPISTDLLKSLATAKPAEASQPGGKAASRAPMPQVKASTKPMKSTMSHTRSSNRGK